jgi:triacylglycerol lipase
VVKGYLQRFKVTALGRRALGGRDASRLFVFGQSAGATHLAGYLVDPALHRAAPRIERAILMSGLFHIDKENMQPNLAAYFGEDESKYKERSPASRISDCNTPLWLALAEFDPEQLATSTLQFAADLCRQRLQSGRQPEYSPVTGRL